MRRIGYTASGREHVAISAFASTAFILHLAKRKKKKKTNQLVGVDVCRVGGLRQLRGPSSCSVTHQSLAECSMGDLTKQLLGVEGWQGASNLSGCSAHLRVRRHALNSQMEG